jgi:hypothetical protein
MAAGLVVPRNGYPTVTPRSLPLLALVFMSIVGVPSAAALAVLAGDPAASPLPAVIVWALVGLTAVTAMVTLGLLAGRGPRERRVVSAPVAAESSAMTDDVALTSFA